MALVYTIFNPKGGGEAGGQDLALNTNSVPITGPCELSMRAGEDCRIAIGKVAAALDPANERLVLYTGERRSVNLDAGTWYVKATAYASLPVQQIGPASASIAVNAQPGTKIADLSNIPPGSIPVFTPNDGRVLVVGNDSDGFDLVLGLAKLSAGTIAGHLEASGATGRDITITVTAPTAVSISGSPPTGKVGDYYSFKPNVAGGWGIKAFLLASSSIFGTGLAIDPLTGEISGVPLRAGTFGGNVIKVMDDSGSATLGSLSIQIDPRVGSGTPTPTPGVLLPVQADVLDVWDGFGIQVFRSGSGQASTFTTSFDYAAENAAWEAAYPGYVTIYQRSTGNNNNDGLTPATAVRSLNVAALLGEANAAAAWTVNQEASTTIGAVSNLRTNTQVRNVGAIIPDATYGDCLYDVVITKPHRFVPSVPGGHADSIINTSSAPTFTPTSDGSIWIVSTAHNRLIDMNNRTPEGLPRSLVPIYLTAAQSVDTATTLTNIRAAWTMLQNIDSDVGDAHSDGVYWFDGTTRYVMLFDGRSVSAAWSAGTIKNITTVTSHRIAPTTVIRCIYEGLKMVGGAQGALQVTSPSALVRPRIVAKRCTFSETNNEGVFKTQGTAAVGGVDYIVEDCAAGFGDLDNWNDHQDGRGWLIRCRSVWGGADLVGSEAFANNCNTIHENGRRICVECIDLYAQDRTVHNVGASKSEFFGGWIGDSRRGNVDSYGGPAGESSGGLISGHPTTSSAIVYATAVKLKNSPFGPARYRMGAYTGAKLYIRDMGAVPANPFAGTLAAFV